jgi:fatty-acyl-CoA synthase
MPDAVEVSSYGATECSSNLTLPYPDDDYYTRMYTLGTPIEGMEAKIVDPETRRERLPGEVGELAYRGYAMFSGYYKDPDRTAECVDQEGWFHSGDLAALDDHGRLIYHGRLKDMLKVGGENVSALEVEGYLSLHPAVQMAQVVSAPDEKYGEVPAAYIQVKQGRTLSEEELIGFCIGQIASYKVPRYCRLVDEWPMSGTKIQKFVLRDWIATELAQRGVKQAPPVKLLARSEQPAAEA